MSQEDSVVLERFHEKLREEYAARFPRSRAHHENCREFLLDGASHAIRSNEPFMPVVRSATGSVIEDLDGHRILDFWQGHYANILGHNPGLIAEELIQALHGGRGLQSGMLHEIEAEVGALICRQTGCETVRLTTTGTLGTFYAMLLARAFTGRDRLLKVGGGWHGSQPFGLKGVSAHESSFDHLESEGLPRSAESEILLARFNDVEQLRETFRQHGDRLACFVLEPVLGAGGGIPVSREYLREARRLTEAHGALLLCDEVVTAFRFRAGDLSSAYGVRPDLMIVGKIIGGGMPVSAVGGRRDVMRLCSAEVGRVKFEGGTYSAHELSLIASLKMMRHLIENEKEIYGRLALLGRHARRVLRDACKAAGMSSRILGTPDEVVAGGSLVFLHATREEGPAPTCPEGLAEQMHPRIGERLLKSCMLLEDLSVRSGLGAISYAHTEAELDLAGERFRAGLERFNRAGLI